MILVPDTSVLIDGRITSMIQAGEYKGATIIVPEAVIAELEAQANNGREIGFSGLAELQSLCKMAEEKTIELKFSGIRPSLEQVKLASGGEIDAMIRNIAIENAARFITSDNVQAEVARAKGLDVIYLKPQVTDFVPLGIDQFFDEHTIAVYLKERVPPMAKKGTIADMKLVKIRDAPTSEYELRALAQEILERAKRDPDGFIEVEKRGVTVVQIGSMRIAIARRPFSDGMEITAVRPIVDVTLKDYQKSDIITKRITSEKRGMIIVGAPGSGKTTLAQNVATFLSDSGFVVKTMEAPRELQVPDNITQYTALDGSMTNTADVLLLVRPDFVIFDELRKNEDFSIFADMRLAGIGMVGVIHASGVQDAIQRFSDRVDFSVLPQIINTVIFVKQGVITKVYDIGFAVKVPGGMAGELNIRPVTTVTDHETGELVLDVFRYDGETIVIPVTAPAAAPAAKTGPGPVHFVGQPLVPEKPARQAEPKKESDERPGWKLMEKEIQREIGRYTDGIVDVQMTSDTKAVVYIDDKDVPAAIGKGGKNVSAIVNKIGIGIDIKPRSEFDRQAAQPRGDEEINLGGGIKIQTDKKQLTIIAPGESGRIVDVFAGKEYLFTATVNETGEIVLAKNSSIAQEMIRRYQNNENIRLRPV
ncbi:MULTISPECIES: PINc/VapC family ATPase [unclassified Methanoregula]|uniref:PINc/VapC family ATPase n=1 Tax=unclassified Methanoregula TaxID=2649730 RepID=UPI0009C59211|nr:MULTISPECIES: PINc/VapC family ATPase [unclassified Methanoregula]OPX64639.1 MAG: putative KH and PIN-domain containing protein [Methanoregula sp. PtaB.Bin085]OPY36007.1 MAG: putative KH and PIN-domain containing protein [Methanoregula sp. PtaU1.Bin006]